MRFYWPIQKLDHEQHMVWGYASTEAEDEQGEVIRRDALAAALEDYMRFANIREMHQPSAVGIAEEAAIDDKGLYLGARIVDTDAWQKVVAGVYKGFSIGGHVTTRDPADRNIVTGLALSEISVVDRPANPEAVFDCWKRAAADPAASPSPPLGGGEGRGEVGDSRVLADTPTSPSHRFAMGPSLSALKGGEGGLRPAPLRISGFGGGSGAKPHRPPAPRCSPEPLSGSALRRRHPCRWSRRCSARPSRHRRRGRSPG